MKRPPLIVDQSEDNLDSEFIYKTGVPLIRAAKERRQVISRMKMSSPFGTIRRC
jgi:hypothetical protein